MTQRYEGEYLYWTIFYTREGEPVVKITPKPKAQALTHGELIEVIAELKHIAGEMSGERI